MGIGLRLQEYLQEFVLSLIILILYVVIVMDINKEIEIKASPSILKAWPVFLISVCVS